MLINSDFEAIKDITIVVLSRDHENFISDCLHSIYLELPDVKILCADTSSTQKCYELGKSISRDLKLNTVHLKLSKGSKTLSVLKILEKYISTKNIVLLSADDALGKNYRNALINLFKENPNGAVFNFTSVITDQNLNPLYSRKSKWSEQKDINIRKLSYSNPGNAPGALIPWTKLISRPAWKEPPQIVIEDYWIWWQLIEFVPFVNCNESSVYYRKHQDNISDASKNEDYANSLGYITAIPNIKASNSCNKIISVALIFRWIRHLNITVWHKFIAGYFQAKRNTLRL